MAILPFTSTWWFYFFDDPSNERAYVLYYIVVSICCNYSPFLRKWSNLATVCNIRYILQLGWKHQLVYKYCIHKHAYTIYTYQSYQYTYQYTYTTWIYDMIQDMIQVTSNQNGLRSRLKSLGVKRMPGSDKVNGRPYHCSQRRGTFRSVHNNGYPESRYICICID